VARLTDRWDGELFPKLTMWTSTPSLQVPHREIGRCHVSARAVIARPNSTDRPQSRAVPWTKSASQRLLPFVQIY
jgi:hypothetical protein